MNLQKSIERIIELFLIFRREVESHNQAGLYDKNHLAEDVLIPILKDTFSCQFLRNLNREQKNYPGIDLGDDQAMVAFQITSDPGIEKIKDALSKFIAHKHYLRYTTLYLYILTKKQKRYSKKSLLEITKGYINFNPDEHIIDSSTIISKVEKLDYEFIQRVEQTLEVHFSNPTKYFVRPHAPTKTETLILNLVPITFPKELFIGRTTYDRQDVIENSWATDFKIPLNSSERSVVWAALRQQGSGFSSDWVIRSDEIITFHNLRDESLALSAIIDQASVDPILVDRYIRQDNGEIDVNRLNVVKELLRNMLRAQLEHRGIVWQHEEELFIFVDPDDREVRKEVWSAGRKDGRVVYHKVRDKVDSSKVWFHEHVAFEAGFDLYDNKWYVALKPDWFCSFNGYNKSKYQHRNRVSFLKRKAHNSDVIRTLLFIVEILHKDQNEALLTQQSGPRITLGELVTITGSPAINDAEWLQQEEKKRRRVLERTARAEDGAPLFASHATGNNS